MTARSWREVDLGDVVEFLDYKRRPLNSTERATRKGPYPYYGASGPFDSVDDYIFDGRYLLVAEDGENLNSRKLPVAFFATGKFWVNNHAHIVRGLKGLADDEFLKHWFAGNNISGYITGAAQPKLSQASMRRIRLLLPAYEGQRRIASILSAYDDLIDNNTRRIAILEEMARRIYEEWFVRFRFPGHEGVRMVESELESVPEGWRVVPLAEMVDTQYGYTESAQDKPVGPKFLRGMDINKQPYIDWSAVPYCPIHPDELLKFKLSVGDVVVIRMADPGKIGIVEKAIDAVFASYLVRLRITDQRMTPYSLPLLLADRRAVSGVHNRGEHRHDPQECQRASHHWCQSRDANAGADESVQ